VKTAVRGRSPCVYTCLVGIKRKASRSIEVDGETYRWAVSDSQQATTGKISVIVEAVSEPAQRLVVRVPCRNFWLDFEDLAGGRISPLPDAYRPVTPATLRQIITAALAAGWQPQSRRKDFTFDWVR
jgi:hypothetical protein